MSNTITTSALTETLYQSRDAVARELTGFIPAVMVNGGSEGASTGGTVTSYRTAEPTLNTSRTPAMTIPAGDDQTIAAETLTLSSVAEVRIPLVGETVKKLQNIGVYGDARNNMLLQGMRVMVNAIEAAVATAAYKGASRAHGTAGTTPFGSTPKLADAANVQKILDDNGAPQMGRQLVIDTSAHVALGSLTQLTNVNEAGEADFLRRGVLTDLFGFAIRKSGQVQTHTAGAGTSYDSDGGEPVGETTLHVDTGSGTILEGDVVSFADTAGKYVVTTTVTPGSGDEDVIIQRPGLIATLADGKDMTIASSYTANVGFHRTAIELAMRPPALPEEGDAGEHVTMFDPDSGLSFDVGLYKGYGMNEIIMSCVYGVKVWKPEFVAILLG